MSQKYSVEFEKILEEMREDIGFYFNKFEKTKKKSDEIRFYFSVMRYYEILYSVDDNPDNKKLCERAKENYERLFPSRDIFSPNRIK